MTITPRTMTAIAQLATAGIMGALTAALVLRKAFKMATRAPSSGREMITAVRSLPLQAEPATVPIPVIAVA
ncbi:hypothetical protein LG293_16630 (plasmid) [Citricoccus nitrophenolicus]